MCLKRLCLTKLLTTKYCDTHLSLSLSLSPPPSLSLSMMATSLIETNYAFYADLIFAKGIVASGSTCLF
jgi:hypothetical protein